MKPSSKLIFFGNERLVSGLAHTNAPILRGLISAGYDVAAVVSHHSEGRSRRARPLEVAEIAREHNIPLLLPEKPIEIEQQLKYFHADAAILAAYGKIIPQRIIDVFEPIGIINIHPSLLPRYRGSTPIETTILNGDAAAGVSIMRLSAGMDEGPVFAQTTIQLHGTESKQDLYDALSTRGAELLLEHLPAILSDKLTARPQQNDDVSYTSQLSKKDSVINVLTDDATTIERKVRAYLNFPKTRLTIENNDVIITSSKVVSEFDVTKLVIKCAHDTYLQVDELIAPSGRTMSGEAFLRGYAK